MTNDRQVTETDQAVARAFGREVPKLTEAAPRPRARIAPEAEFERLIGEFKELRVSRLGDSTNGAHNAAVVERAMVLSTITGKVRDSRRLAMLRESVDAMRAELPLAEGAAPRPVPPSRDGAVDWTRQADKSVAEAFGRPRQATITTDRDAITQAEETAARAFGRTTKGDQ